MQVLMLAAENGAVAGAKVGGMADVIRDLPKALAEAKQGVTSHVAMPAFGDLISNANATWIAAFEVPFAGRMETVDIYQSQHPENKTVRIFFFSHPQFQGEYKGVYSQGTSQRPFAEDASKFALFSMAATTALQEGLLPMPDVLHLHDWHMAMVAMLIAFEPKFASLSQMHLVYTVHNLALQGTRPIDNEASSLQAWFPHLWRTLTSKQQQQIIDPRYANCINPMRMGINLADKVHLVSPTYAKEVLQSSKPELGFFGGEGLEGDLLRAADAGKLVGILNGCQFGTQDDVLATSKTSKRKQQRRLIAGLTKIEKHKQFLQLLNLAEISLIKELGQRDWGRSQELIALSRIARFRQVNFAKHTPSILLTSVGRLTDQKVLILRQVLDSGQSVLEASLALLKTKDENGLFIMLGSGDEQIGNEFMKVAAKFDNFLFINSYDEQISNELYRLGDLFVMPSSFEPCGISQMLALSQGQLCLVHGVGGLKDTVPHKELGFVFNGENLSEQAIGFMACIEEAFDLYQSKAWQLMEHNALSAKFDWHSQIKRYLSELYC